MVRQLTPQAAPAAQTISNPSLRHAPASPSAEDQFTAAAMADPSVFVEPELTVRVSSAARAAASRANGALSHGALSPATRAICAQNHTIHGLARHQNGTFKLLASEDPIAFEALKQSLFDEHLPETTTESILINGMAEANWLAARAQRLQDTCMNPETGEVTDDKKFSLYLRYQTTHTRAFHRSLNDLAKLRKEKHKADLGLEAQEMKNQMHAAQLLKKEAETRHQVALAAEKIAASRRTFRDYENIHALELAKMGLSNEPKAQKAEAA